MIGIDIQEFASREHRGEEMRAPGSSGAVAVTVAVRAARAIGQQLVGQFTNGLLVNLQRDKTPGQTAETTKATHFREPLSECAPGGIRTPNLLIRSQMLYPLSYGRVGVASSLSLGDNLKTIPADRACPCPKRPVAASAPPAGTTSPSALPTRSNQFLVCPNQSPASLPARSTAG